MKKLLILSLLSLLFFTACDNNCDSEENPSCLEVVPTNEICLAFFTQWFYNSETKTCEEIGYSGCSLLGFATEEECESCKCN